MGLAKQVADMFIGGAAGNAGTPSPMHTGNQSGGEPLPGGRGNGGSRIGVSAADAGKSYDHGLGFGPGLAGAPKHQVGRRMDDPDRTAERLGRLARSTGNVEIQMGLLNRADRQQAGREGMEFQARRDDTQWERQKEMFGLETQDRDARETRRGEREDRMWDREQQDRNERERRHFQNQMTMFGLNQGAEAMQHERDRNEREQDEQRRREYGLKPVQAEGTSTPYFQDYKGSIFAGSAPAQKPNLEMMTLPGTNMQMPMFGGKPITGAPMLQARPVENLPPNQAGPRRPGHTLSPVASKPGSPPQVKEFKSEDGMKTEYRQWDAEKGGWTKVKFLDENGDGIDDRQQQEGGGKQSGFLGRFAKPGAPAPTVTPSSTAPPPSGQTSSERPPWDTTWGF